jgi:hypothetical protein
MILRQHQDHGGLSIGYIRLREVLRTGHGRGHLRIPSAPGRESVWLTMPAESGSYATMPGFTNSSAAGSVSIGCESVDITDLAGGW